MTDFDGFEDNFGPPADETDPAAEFLAREHDELSGLEDDGLMVNGASDGIGNYNYFSQEIPNNELNGPTDIQPPLTISPQPSPPKVKEVPEKIRKWKEEQEKMLAEKDEQEEKKKEELRLNATKELEEWYKHDQEQIEKTRAQNRESSKNAEREYVMERDSAADADAQDWERIAKLCDFNPKLSKNTKDVSRMRSIILQLKQTPLVKS